MLEIWPFYKWRNQGSHNVICPESLSNWTWPLSLRPYSFLWKISSSHFMHSWPRQELVVWAHPEDGLWQWAGKQAPGLAREPSCSVVEWLSIAHIAPSSLSYKKAADGLVEANCWDHQNEENQSHEKMAANSTHIRTNSGSKMELMEQGL